MDRRPPASGAPDLFTALELEPARATPPIEREPPASLAPAHEGVPLPRTRMQTPALSTPPAAWSAFDDDDEPPTAPQPIQRAAPPAAAAAPERRPVPAPARPRERTRLGLGTPPAPRPGGPPPPGGSALPAPGQEPPRRLGRPPAPRPQRRGTMARPGPAPAPGVAASLADLLEPAETAPPKREPTGIQGIVAELSSLPSPQVPMPEAERPLVDIEPPAGLPDPELPSPSAAAGFDPSPSWEAPVRRSSGMIWGFAALSVMLAAALGWVLYTQTDIFEGDVVAKRDAEAKAEAEAALAEAEAEAQRDAIEYGTVQLSSEPEGARVWMLQPGPTAKFDNLPVDGEYMIAVTAPGHVPRMRVVKGSELSAPVIMDLDPVADPAGPAAAIPDGPVPKIGKDLKKTVTLELRSNTPGAELGLLVGYTPGVSVVDLDVREAHRFLVTLAGYAPASVEVKGRFFEEQGDALVYDDVVKLVPAADAVPTGGDADEIAIDDDE